MTSEDWEPFRAYTDKGVAEALAARLESEGVPSNVQARRLESGVDANFVVFVTRRLAHRARWILAQLPPEEADVYYLATGELPK